VSVLWPIIEHTSDVNEELRQSEHVDADSPWILNHWWIHSIRHRVIYMLDIY